jgi:lipoyl(octanoyl) transferase
MVIDWGILPYEEAFQRQLECVDRRLSGEMGDALIFVEHPPVYTIGRRPESKKHLLLSPEALAQQGIALSETNRGGDITHHAPGQMVAYPIIDLKPYKDLHVYLRFLEETVIQTLLHFGVHSHRNPGKTGIWIGTQKIAAIGIAVRQWVTYHGVALNVDNDLSLFNGIVPCGIPSTEGTVTHLQDHFPKPISVENVKPIFAKCFWDGLRAW